MVDTVFLVASSTAEILRRADTRRVLFLRTCGLSCRRSYYITSEFSIESPSLEFWVKASVDVDLE